MIYAWRIVKARHASGAFSGLGAKTFGGRWNSRGVGVVYTAGSVSLAMLEMLVHLEAEEILRHYVVFEVTFEERLVTTVAASELPRAWRRSPAPAAVQMIGDAWVAEGKSAVLRVPSTIVPSENNYLLSPAHRDFGKIKIGAKTPLYFDRRFKAN